MPVYLPNLDIDFLHLPQTLKGVKKINLLPLGFGANKLIFEIQLL